ncbi:GIY-YIG nuclease family protein [Salinimicrobium soli]
MKKGYTYILSNRSRTVLYVGVTANINRRMAEHKSGKGGVFTRKYSCNILVYYEEFMDIRQAIAREKQLKNWHREWKWNLIKMKNPELIELLVM